MTQNPHTSNYASRNTEVVVVRCSNKHNEPNGKLNREQTQSASLSICISIHKTLQVSLRLCAFIIQACNCRQVHNGAKVNKAETEIVQRSTNGNIVQLSKNVNCQFLHRIITDDGRRPRYFLHIVAGHNPASSLSTRLTERSEQDGASYVVIPPSSPCACACACARAEC